MRFRTIASVAAGAAALTLAVAGCSSSSTPSASSVASAAQSVASQAQSAASSVASRASSAVSSVQSAVSGAVADSQVLASAKNGKVVVGIKFTQPGLGVKNADGTFSGFDVEVAKYVAKELGVDPTKIEFVEANSAQREDLIAKGQVDYIVATYSITDARKAGDRVLFMADGEIVEDGAPQEFFTNPTSNRAKDFLSKILTH